MYSSFGHGKKQRWFETDEDMTPEQRSKCMSRIHSKDTSIEVCLRRALYRRGYRYRKNYKELPGTPDIVLTKYKIAIFCDSEFFHGRDWENGLHDKIKGGHNPDYWEKKIQHNIERDNQVDRELSEMGWRVLRFWGCDIMKETDECIKAIEECISEIVIREIESTIDTEDTE